MVLSPNFQEENAEEFTLVEMIMDKDMTERVMDRDECPWPQLIKARRVSLSHRFIACRGSARA